MTDSHEILSKLKLNRVIIPMVIGLGVVGYMLVKDFDKNAFNAVEWSPFSPLWLFIAFLLTAARDFGYMIRIRLLTDHKLTWKRSFVAIMLWEFASSITPSVVGGAPIAIFILNKEGISTGRSTAIVMITALLDELFYIITAPVLFLIVGAHVLFPVEMTREILGITLNTQGIFWAGYGFILVLTSVILFAVFYRPRGFKYLLLSVFRLKFLRRWRRSAAETGDDIIISSREFKGKNIVFWIKAFGATFLSWTARYWVVNFLILTIVSVDDHLLIYARQLVMWVIMLISPTPGSSGVAEFAFQGFLGEFLPAAFLLGIIIFLWRILSFYLYLVLGMIILPRWIRKVFRKEKKPEVVRTFTKEEG